MDSHKKAQESQKMFAFNPDFLCLLSLFVAMLFWSRSELTSSPVQGLLFGNLI